jgi:hypothetical protein
VPVREPDDPPDRKAVSWRMSGPELTGKAAEVGVLADLRRGRGRLPLA